MAVTEQIMQANRAIFEVRWPRGLRLTAAITIDARSGSAMTSEEIDPRVAHEDDIETLILSLLALAEVATNLADGQLVKLRELSESLDSTGANLLEINEAMRLTLLSDIRSPRRPRETYLLDISPLLQEMSDSEDRPSHGIQGLGSSLVALTNLTRQALSDPVTFGRRKSLLARLATLVGATWPQGSR